MDVQLPFEKPVLVQIKMLFVFLRSSLRILAEEIPLSLFVCSRFHRQLCVETEVTEGLLLISEV